MSPQEVIVSQCGLQSAIWGDKRFARELLNHAEVSETERTFIIIPNISKLGVISLLWLSTPAVDEDELMVFVFPAKTVLLYTTDWRNTTASLFWLCGQSLRVLILRLVSFAFIHSTWQQCYEVSLNYWMIYSAHLTVYNLQQCHWTGVNYLPHCGWNHVAGNHIIICGIS